MARPLKHDTGPVITVLINGKSASWCDGILTGDKEILKAADFAIRTRSEYRLGFAEVTAGDDSLLGIAAARPEAGGRLTDPHRRSHNQQRRRQGSGVLRLGP